MTKHLRFLIVLLMTLVWSAGWAAEAKTVVSTLAQKSSGCTSDVSGIVSWSYTDANSTDANKRGIQWYTPKNVKLTANFSSTVKITKVVINANTNASTGSTIELKVGLTSYGKEKITKGATSATGNSDYTFTGTETNNAMTLILNSSKSLYVNKVTITYEEDTKTPTSLSFPKASFSFATTDDLSSFTGQTATLSSEGTTLTGKTITYSKSGDDIFTSFDTTNGTLALNGNAGTATVTATFNGSNDDTYASSSASYTITVKEVIKDIATLKEKLTTSLQYFTLKLTDAIVTYKSDDVLYIQDKTAGIYCSGSTTLNNNDKVNGLVDIKAYIYNGQRTITQWTLADDATIEKGAAFTPEVVTLAQLNDNIDKYENMRVKVIGATANAAMSNNQTKLTQDGASLVLFSKVKTISWDFVADDVLDIEGYPVTYTKSSTKTKELLVYKKGDVAINSSVVATTLSFNTETTAFNVEKNSESSFTAPKAVVKDAAGNVVEGAKITYVSDAPTIASVDENGNVTFGSVFGTATITASYAGDDTHKPAADNSYTITYSKIPTEMAWSESSVSVNIGEQPSLPTLKLTAHGKVLADKTITYSSSDESVAVIGETSGIITIGSNDGSTTITATFAGDDTYEEATAKYTLNVMDPNKTDFAFDFTKPESYGYAKPVSGGKTDLSNGDVLVSGRVTITNEKGASTTTRFKDDSGNVTFRVYTGAILTVEVPAGFAINRIDFTDDGTHKVDNFTFSTGELNLNTWTGLTKKLTMKVTNAQVFLKNMTVNLVKVENVTLNESEINTIEAKALANVTLKRTMKAGVWNTICLPFDVSKEQATTAFGEGVKIAELDESSTGTTLSFKNVDKITATKPYLIKPTNDAPADGYKFVGVTIKDDGKGNFVPDAGITKDLFGFVGIYNKADVTEDIKKTAFNGECYAAFLGANNTVFGAKQGTNMKGFRAYFAIPNGVKAPELRVVIDGTATSIKNIDSEVVEDNAPVYNLQGQRVDGNNLTPGIYVKAGKKFVVK